LPYLPGRLTTPSRIAVAALLWTAGLCGCADGERPPRLVLLLVVDQLRADRLDPALPGGLGRLAREGRWYVDAVVGHAHTETCPGHVAAASGRHPGPVGVPGNQYVDARSGKLVYCVEDEAPDARVHGASHGRSPRAIAATALGDWLEQADPRTRVFSVSAKDRSAIGMGGQHPDAAYWLERQEARGFTTSAYYRPDLPAWVRSFNGEGGAAGFLAGLPPTWEHPTGSPPNGARPDAYAGEIGQLSGTSPHPLAGGDASVTLEQLFVSPFLDDVTLDFARTLVENEDLGRGEQADLLALSLSATDLVGHYYGPESQEARDALVRLDAALGRFLSFLERRVGRGRLLVALTSDHGVLPLPEWLEETGRGTCPVRGGRVDPRGLGAALESILDATFGADTAGKGPWLHHADYRVTVSRERAQAAGVTPQQVVERAREMLEAQPVVERVWTAEEITAGSGPEPFATLYRNSHHPERGGDLVVQPRRDCLIAGYAGTSHGTPYLDDSAIPLVFFGPGVQPGRVRGRAGLVDLAPSVAAHLGLALPLGLDGRALNLNGEG